MMRIERVTCSWASKPASDPVEPFTDFEGRDAEAAADDLLRGLVVRDRETRASRWVHFLVSLENGDRWEFTQDLDYTYANDTVRQLAARSARMEEFYGDSPARAGRFRTALLSHV